MRPKKAIDTHVHFWKMESYRPYAGWFKDKTFLAQDYLPTDLEPALATCNVESAIIVGAAPDSQEHNVWCGQLVEEHPSVSGLVGSYTFENPNLSQCLDVFTGKPWFLGIRALPAAPPEQWVDDPQAQRGMAELQKRNLSLDMLMDHTLLPAVVPFAQKYGETSIIVNHCGLPPFSSGELSLWADNIHTLTTAKNVYMKYSSFFLHAHPAYDLELCQQAANVLLDAFGPSRLLWGSNWPPELLGGTYDEAYVWMLGCLDQPTNQLSQSEIDAIYYDNARRVYGGVA